MRKFIAVAATSIAALTASQSAYAQEPERGPSDAAQGQGQSEPRRAGMEEIVVTATKVATNVQDVPIAITAITSDALEERGLQTASDLGAIVPNATFRKSQGIYGPAVSVYLRGIGQTDPQFSGEPAVAYYIDDVYYPFLFGSQFDLLDLDHVEVLRGPQGTLFGRNSIAGAVNMVSKTPSLTDASAFVEVTVGSYDRRDARAGFSVPVTDNLALGASFVSKKRTGYQDMVDFSCQMYKDGTPELAGSFPFQTPKTTFGPGQEPDSCVFDHLGGEDTRAIRGSLYWEPTDGVSLSISADYLDQNDEITAEYIFETDYAQTTTRGNFVTAFDQFSIPGETPFRWDERFETGDPYKTYDNYCDAFPAGTNIEGNTYYNGSVFRGGKCYGNTVPLKNRGVQGKLIVGLTDSVDFTAIAGWRALDMSFGAASDGTPLNDSIIFHSYDEDHVTGELRLTGQHDWLDWVGGVFYYKGTALHLGQPQGVRAGTQRYQTDTYKPESIAGYANAILRPTDRLSLTGGLRYSDDKKVVDFNSINDGTPPGQTEFVAGGVSTIFDITIATKRWDWKAGIDYELTPDVLVYASAGSGYRLPGFNARPSQPGQEGQTAGEALISYEIGAKAELLDRRLRLNVAVFQMDFTERPAGFSGQEAQLTDDLQGFVPGDSTVVPDGPAGTSYSDAFSSCRPYDAGTDGPRNVDGGVGVNCVARAFNYALADGTIRGFEGEIEAEPIDGLRINGSVGYNTFKAPDLDRRTSVPDWTASGGIQYDIRTDMLHGTITPRLDWFYTGKIAYNSALPEYDGPAYSVFNGRITYANEDHDFEVALGATNLFNKFYYRQKIIFQAFGLPTNLGQPAPPREWYLSFKKRF
ncbi:TonB-dependent receptor [Altericroceibacterium endophyticum]|uniref:TonB-dependent receptor n=1 Tax=Altericroceibacterium endophyticum TaxID=1808508 RepID=A0A6I4TA92_9SPHN|nr:TonB-dependent receptor [Altericroceibacterium endophyticum]MXO67091.1 TonB-dependent receptor [Altericroceibacterium endophyticum]